jgi:hypothetical protein
MHFCERAASKGEGETFALLLLVSQELLLLGPVKTHAKLANAVKGAPQQWE